MEESSDDNFSMVFSNSSWLISAINQTNCSDCDHHDLNLYRHSSGTAVVLLCAYMTVFILGLIGNCFVIAVVFRSPRMRNVTNYFIVNLAVADILVIVFCLPANLLSSLYIPWMLGWFMCKSVTYIQTVSVSASVNSLVAVSLDRFLAIWFPLRPQITKRTASGVVILIWIVAIGSAIPMAVYFNLVSYIPNPHWQFCVEVWPNHEAERLYFLIAHLLLCYLLPLKLISAFYILIWFKVAHRAIPGDSRDASLHDMQQRSKIKVVKMLVVVVISFMLSWMPLYIIFARIKLGGEVGELENYVLGLITPLAQWLGSFNSCINPILYAFFNKKYRSGFLAIVKSRSCCGTLRSNPYQTTMRRSTCFSTHCTMVRSDTMTSALSNRTSLYNISRHNHSFNDFSTERFLPPEPIQRSRVAALGFARRGVLDKEMLDLTEGPEKCLHGSVNLIVGDYSPSNGFSDYIITSRI